MAVNKSRGTGLQVFKHEGLSYNFIQKPRTNNSLLASSKSTQPHKPIIRFLCSTLLSPPQPLAPCHSKSCKTSLSHRHRHLGLVHSPQYIIFLKANILRARAQLLQIETGFCFFFTDQSHHVVFFFVFFFFFQGPNYLCVVPLWISSRCKCSKLHSQCKEHIKDRGCCELPYILWTDLQSHQECC